eukprot:s1934_g12.t1
MFSHVAAIGSRTPSGLIGCPKGVPGLEEMEDIHMPPGWVVYKDDQGRTCCYYPNPETGESSWEPPAPPVAPPRVVLPDGWTAHQDPETGRTFYANIATGESSWEPPTVEPPPPPPPPPEKPAARNPSDPSKMKAETVVRKGTEAGKAAAEDCTDIHQAAEKGNIGAVRDFLRDPKSLESKDRYHGHRLRTGQNGKLLSR